MKDWYRVSLILALITLNTILHYSTTTDVLYLHEIYQRVYYIPILLASFWYGPVGGIAAATLACSYYVFHIRQDWAHMPVYSINQYAEIVLYYLVGTIMGILSSRQKQEARKLMDTTGKLRQAYDQLRQTSQQLRRSERLAALGALTAGIAHEIRNPLASIKGAVDIIDRKNPKDVEGREFLDVIREEVKRLNATLTEFLRFGNPTASQFEPVSANELIRSTLKLLEGKLSSSEIEVGTELEPDLPAIQADPAQIRQVLINLILNSLEAMPEGGELMVRTSLHEPGQIRIEVGDTGHGISDEIADQVFDPFFTSKPTGMGLGLSICHQLIQTHGGSIALKPRPEGGLRVVVDLPREPAKV